MKNITNSLFVFGAAVLLISSIVAFSSPAPSYEYTTFTTIESKLFEHLIFILSFILSICVQSIHIESILFLYFPISQIFSTHIFSVKLQ